MLYRDDVGVGVSAWETETVVCDCDAVQWWCWCHQNDRYGCHHHHHHHHHYRHVMVCVVRVVASRVSYASTPVARSAGRHKACYASAPRRWDVYFSRHLNVSNKPSETCSTIHTPEVVYHIHTSRHSSMIVAIGSCHCTYKRRHIWMLVQFSWPDPTHKWSDPTRPHPELTWNSGPDQARPIYARLTVLPSAAESFSLSTKWLFNSDDIIIVSRAAAVCQIKRP